MQAGEETALGSTGKSYNVNAATPELDPSLYGKLKVAKTESSGTADFFKKLGILCVGTVGCSVCLGLFLVIPIANIAIGSIYLKDCPKQRFIPIYLIVGGVVWILQTLTNLAFKCRKSPDDEKEGKVRANPVEGVLSTFLFAWFIAGNVWVYGIHKKFTTTDPSADDYCNPTLYWYSFWLITLSYILLGLSCCCFCCVGCCGVKHFASKYSQEQTAGQQPSSQEPSSQQPSTKY